MARRRRLGDAGESLAVCATRVTYDHNLLHLQAQNLESVKWEMTLIEHTAGASWHAVSIADSREKALALKARYEKLPEVSRVVEVASLVPPDQDEKLPLLADIQDRLRTLPERSQNHRTRPAQQQATSRRTDGFSSETAHVVPGRWSKQSGAVGQSAADASRVARPFASRRRQNRGRRGVEPIEGLRRETDGRPVGGPAPAARRVDAAGRSRSTDLPEDLRERYVGPNGKWLLRVFAKDGLWDFGPLEHFTEVVRTVDPEATGKPFGTVEGLKAMKKASSGPASTPSW